MCCHYCFFKVIEKKGSITPIFKNLLKNFFLCTTVPIACWLQSHASRGLKPDVPDAGGGLGTDEVYNQMSHLLSIPNVFVSAIFRLITNCTREITPLESTNCTRNGTCCIWRVHNHAISNKLFEENLYEILYSSTLSLEVANTCLILPNQLPVRLNLLS